MPRAYLVDRIVEVLRADQRVQAAWLSGSLGRGGGDEFSDVDVVVAVADIDRNAFIAGWEAIGSPHWRPCLRSRPRGSP